MTLYWWMHWFWITLLLSATCCEKAPTTSLHSTSTYLPDDTISNSSEIMVRIFEPPPTTADPTEMKNITARKNITITKLPRPSPKKVDFHFPPPSTKGIAKENKETVINQTNATDTSNFTDNQLLNTSFNAINYTNNLTYFGEEGNTNQSLGQRINVEDGEDRDISQLSAAGITGITLGCVVVVGTICGISFFLYRTRGLNRPQVLNDRCSNPDSSGYIDDASVRDNSEEMYSLDNDSFLNSLEAMTIQNYWTDTVKHTKL